ncbi:PfkB family carbohydrate kinase [Neobacillus drentensis]|uniref:PfkB family carbohydrate kinase n=1 Tax=Neobacillus drentensis TaxID=220684 RepID=UPI0030023B64
MKMKLISIGDNVVDFYQDQQLMYPGGNALNVAVLSKRNGAEESAYLGIMGNDSAAAHIMNCLSLEGINIDRMRRAFGPNGKATVSLNSDGDRGFIGTNRDSRVSSLLKLSLTLEDFDYINQFDIIHTSINSDLEHELSNLAHKPISFDFSTKDRWNENYLKQVCPYLTVAFFSGSGLETSEITSLIEKVHDLGVKIVGVTRGAEPVIFSDRKDLYEQGPVSTHVVDTMGAGDSFIAGFLTSYYDLQDMRKALIQASHSAAKTCTEYGAFGYGIKI